MPAPSRSVLHPAGPQAAHRRLWWLMFWICTARRARSHAGAAIAIAAQPAPAAERPLTCIRAVGRRASASPCVILVALLFASVRHRPRDRSLRRPADARHRGRRAISGGGRSRYRRHDPAAERFTTANELHIPVGRPVRLELTSHRRHPQLLGAQPARQDRPDPRAARTSTGSQADRPGVYRGQCAEFCGLQHAHMALLVVAEPPDALRALAARAASAGGGARRRRRAAAGRRGLPRRRVRDVPHGPRARRPAGDGPRPHPPRESRAPSPPARCRTPAGTSPAGSPIRSRSSRATACRRGADEPGRAAGAAHLPGDAAMSATVGPPTATRRQPTRCERRARRPGRPAGLHRLARAPSTTSRSARRFIVTGVRLLRARPASWRR